METTRRGFIGAVGALGAMAGDGMLSMAHASGTGDWPHRQPIKLIMPHAPGGPTDVVARTLAPHIGTALGQTLFVESRVGASGNIGTEYVARAAPDGYTVLYQTSGLAIMPALFRKLPYDPLAGFAPVAMPADINVILLVRNSLPVADLSSFLQYLKDHPGKLSYGSGGRGNITHLAVEVLLRQLGSSAVHVPYKGTAPAMVDLLGGQIDFMLDAINTAYPYVKDGRVRALAVTGGNRSPLLPQLPTVAEAGVPGYAMSTWQCMLVPAGTPASIVQALNAAVNKAVADPDLQKQFAAVGVQLQSSTPAQLEARLRADIPNWIKVAQAAGVQPE
ncbi:Argininosuccinate lyase [Variovorax sp. SRS16]|uniref:Bug family tripartite tricarboxylate transporter substrate binding protein n=1 Tax=Variovorax sp. SRS16 TaxID=282217 RepID=UPI0013171E38|nr:tripartite tricarboxylate transporter substrate binding protein [Variovorax sp. SRS16]VTU26138.1 Argininosuccinate lyase [Variovorax sp. SRS16]